MKTPTSRRGFLRNTLAAGFAGVVGALFGGHLSKQQVAQANADRRAAERQLLESGRSHLDAAVYEEVQSILSRG